MLIALYSKSMKLRRVSLRLDSNPNSGESAVRLSPVLIQERNMSVLYV